ncbi:MupA/Atu3671 family FMN-dependent luciferase-like monooxygenase [Peterkaempfera bronchialis]|uniref:LLM class flavin-dependent oxidoreductase n=1 Tax=Peterkaempfera bronchialis TaxID=2126346 RepID=A0A345SYP9_9ACTN|nr:MupA/Atu3671 family FMN-dependent luciferase-like monooxygenase [Peterkaempfera bronchialis]AXI78854.1 LLM class flavin-dependent oxidoreductase [Peterkaempfera bronchialis]
MDFSLIFFSGDEKNKYRFVLDAARYADEHGFTAIWTPERHFHRFGGLYPNPAVLGAALAMATQRLRIRAGSVVLPLHSPIRVAEEWAVVDNLSRGRAGIALATGFSPLDFAINPGGWQDRRQRTFDAVTTLRELWEGAPVYVQDGLGNHVEVELHPQPVQPELPIWLTCTKSPETFEAAGRMGCNVLTALIDMTNEELEEKLALYFKTLEAHGHDPESVTVTLMLHTFIGTDLDEVRETVRQPFSDYLRSFFTVIDSQKKNTAPGAGVRDMSQSDQDQLIGFAFDKYFGKGALLGTPDSCGAVVERFRGMGVTEIACLIDFGVDEELVVQSLSHLDELRGRYA